jgi:hypothetical protein
MLFYYIAWGRNTELRKVGNYEIELEQAVGLCATNGGLNAFSTLFWATCVCSDPLVLPHEANNIELCVVALLIRLQKLQATPHIQQTLARWYQAEASKRDGMLAGFYALFDASIASPVDVIKVGYNAFTFAAGEFLVLMKVQCSVSSVEQAIKYPYQGSDTFPGEDTWLCKCLRATRKLGVAQVMSGLTSRLAHCVDGIPWATQAIKTFVEQAAAKQANKPEQQCAFPGCRITNTASCPLRKCGRCQHVRYCCQLHQKDHWPTHKHECRRLAAEDTAIDVAPSVLPSAHASEDPVINIAPSVLPSAHASEDPVMNIAPSIPSAHASEDPVTEVAHSILPIAHLCAFPDCDVGTVLRPLERCSRCRAAYYCGPAHQRAHWPTHKSACVKQPAPAPTSGAGAAPPPPSTSADPV